MCDTPITSANEPRGPGEPRGQGDQAQPVLAPGQPSAVPEPLAQPVQQCQETQEAPCQGGVSLAPAVPQSVKAHAPMPPVEVFTGRPPSLFPSRSVETYSMREVGLEGEEIARSYLTSKGFELLEKNWRCSEGEADIVMLDGETVVLVEVKTRLDLREGEPPYPEVAVNGPKLKRYKAIANRYVMLNPKVRALRFDVVAVTLLHEKHALINHFTNAYAWDE